MPKDTKTLGNSKARACESLGFVHKKGCARVLTQPPFLCQHYLSADSLTNIYFIYKQYLSCSSFLYFLETNNSVAFSKGGYNIHLPSLIIIK